jgi:hypothetical protein
MDKLESYRTHVQDILRNYQRLFSSPPDFGNLIWPLSAT